MPDEAAVLIDTPVGPVAGVIAIPSSKPVAASLFLHGKGARFGTNRLWARTARSFAERGIATLRIDYPGRGESSPGSGSNEPMLEGVLAAARWLRERTGANLYVAGFCFGARLAVELASRDPGVRGLALVDLRLRESRRRYSSRSVPKPLRLPLKVMQIMYQRARGRPRPHLAPLDMNLVRSVNLLAGRIPVWVLLGQRQGRAAEFDEVGDALGPIDVRIEPGLRLHSLSTPPDQEEVLRQLQVWAEETVGAGVPA